MKDGMKEIIRTIVRGTGFWFCLGVTAYLMVKGIEIQSWWVALVMLMVKLYYDQEQKNGN